jgi:hypothetical protein
VNPQQTIHRREIVDRLLAAERGVVELLGQAAEATEDPDERKLYLRLRDVETKIATELAQVEAQIDAEEFVARAIDV